MPLHSRRNKKWMVAVGNCVSICFANAIQRSPCSFSGSGYLSVVVLRDSFCGHAVFIDKAQSLDFPEVCVCICTRVIFCVSQHSSPNPPEPRLAKFQQRISDLMGPAVWVETNAENLGREIISTRWTDSRRFLNFLSDLSRALFFCSLHRYRRNTHDVGLVYRIACVWEKYLMEIVDVHSELQGWILFLTDRLS